MKRLLPWAFNLAAAVSTLLCVAAASLWVRSRTLADSFYDGRSRYDAPDERLVRVGWTLDSDKGQLLITRSRDITTVGLSDLGSVEPYFITGLHHASLPATGQCPAAAGRYGFGFERWDAHGADFGTGFPQWRTGWAVAFPHWAVACLALPLPVAWLIAFLLRRRRRAAGVCRSCGYDLRATPEQGGALLGRCPECGAVPAGPRDDAPVTPSRSWA